MIEKMIIKAIKDATNLQKEHLDQIREQLEGLPELPTVLITVQAGIADYQFLPQEQPRTVNIIIVDADVAAVGDPIVINRGDAGDIK